VNADAPTPSVPEVPEAERRLLAGVERRIARAMLVLGVAGAAGFWLWRGGAWAAGFTAGAVLSAINFVWLKNAVNVLSNAVSPEQHGPKRGVSGTVARFVLRYALIGAAGYVIFGSSALSLEAFFAGLFVAIGAILAEAAYEIYRGFRDS